ncbi:MAG: hypothetical protein PUB97_07135 [Ruminococcus sp.]|nr:hypothetical protein [Ruminococcus sp.]
MRLEEVLREYLNKPCHLGVKGNNIQMYYAGIIEQIGEGWIRFVDNSRYEYIIPTASIAYIRNDERREKKKRNE